jgi:hypothetical protein
MRRPMLKNLTVPTGRAWEGGGTGLSQPMTVAATKAARTPRLEHWCCVTKEAKAYESERPGSEIPFQGLALYCMGQHSNMHS